MWFKWVLVMIFGCIAVASTGFLVKSGETETDRVGALIAIIVCLSLLCGTLYYWGA